MRKALAGVVLAGLALACAAPAQAADEATLKRYAGATWASFVAMTDEDSGLPADALHNDGTRSVQTSTTNIGAYMWSALVAEKLGLISHAEVVERLGKTLTSLEHMERHESGQYFNWYDHRTGEKLTTWPPTGEPLLPWLSSVDNGWLAVGLRTTASRVEELRARANAIYASMDFGFYYRPARNQILFHYAPSNGDAPCCYDTTVSESRIASYIGIEKGELPQRHYYGTSRSFPDSCDWSWVETRPVGFTRTYLGQDVYEGAYRYNGTRVTPSWGGSMFEALMPSLFVPEERWAPGSWGSNHPLTVAAQIHHGNVEAGYGYWGFSPANIPEGGYRAYGVDAIGMDPRGNPSNNDYTLVDHGWDDLACVRDPQPDPAPNKYTNGVVSPHAAFLALRYAPAETVANLRRLEQDFAASDVYDRWGFRDSINVDSGVASDFYLSLDQGMIMAAIGNALGGDMLREAFVVPETKRRVRPLMGVEEFNSDPRGCTITGTPGADVLRGTGADDVICGLGGDDDVDGGGGGDAIFGDAGADRVNGASGEDTVYGGEGNDQLDGGRGDDVLSGGPGDDRLDGGLGADYGEGGAGADTCVEPTGRGNTASGC